MSNGLLDVMKYCADEKVKSANIPHYVSGVITSVSEDMFRADIKLEQDQVLKNMLNKSGEELEVGDTIWLEYFTYPSSGWIARRNGKPKPMGGSGSATTVENAAVMLDSTFHDYAVDNQMILNVEPQGRLYYGLFDSGSSWAGKSGMCIVQGHYCVFGYATTSAVSYNSGTDQWTIFGSTNLYDAIIANHDKFGRQIGNESNGLGGFLFDSASNKTYPDKYENLWVDIASCTGNTSGVSYSGSGYYSIYTTSGASSANWWEGSVYHSTPATTSNTFTLTFKNSTNGSNLSGRLHECFLVPVVTSWNDGSPSSTGLVSPFGYVRISGFLLFTRDDEGWGVYATNISTSGSQGAVLARVPLISEAERCFFLGISQKTEPVYP